MDCKDCKRLLSKFLDHQLDLKQQKQMNEHLQECPACAQSLESIQEMVRMMHDLKRVNPPADFIDKVNDKLDKAFFGQNLLKRLKNFLYISYPARAFAVVATVIIVVAVTNKLNIHTLQSNGFIEKDSAEKQETRGGRIGSASSEPLLLKKEKAALDYLSEEAVSPGSFADHDKNFDQKIIAENKAVGKMALKGSVRRSTTDQVLILSIKNEKKIKAISDILVYNKAEKIKLFKKDNQYFFYFEINYDRFLKLHSVLAGLGDLQKKTQDINFKQNVNQTYDFNQQDFSQKIPVKLKIEVK